MSFTHLHLHTHASLLDGAIRPIRLVERLKELGQTSCAITDHGTMAGVFDFHRTMRENGLKPILGCEFYYKELADSKERKLSHLTLIAQNKAGYGNLLRLQRIAANHTYNTFGRLRPCIGWTDVESHAEGLICLSACMVIPFGKAVLAGDLKLGAAKSLLERFSALFPGKLFVELMKHGIPDEDKVNAAMAELAQEMGLPLIATQDCHYVRKEDKDAHDILLCIGTKQRLDKPGRFTFTGHYHVASEAEMCAILPKIAVQNTQLVVEMVEDFDLVEDEKHYPKWKDAWSTLTGLCVRGFEERYGVDVLSDRSAIPQYTERARYELGVIRSMGFPDYFCIVADIVAWARSQNIPVGPGRGSGAGSLVAYLLGITDLDPIVHGLLFERFLNPDRCSPPDFDIDVCEARRSEIVAYVKEKYGKESVVGIATYGRLTPKALLKDAARALGMPFKEGLWLNTKLDSTWKWPEVLTFLEENPDAVPDWSLSVAKRVSALEGVNRNQGLHACGLIIGDRPLHELVPLVRDKSGELVTQYEGGPCEELGLLKMDLLGSKAQTVIAETRRLINEQA